MSRILSFALVILVLAAPAALACDLAATITADPRASICNGAAPTLHADVTGGDGAYTYQWFQNASAVEGATSSSLAVTTPGYFWVDVTDGIGCAFRSDVLTINDEDPSANIIPSVGCIGSTSYAQVPNAGNGATYAWTLTNATLMYGQNDRWIYFVPTASPVTIEVTVTTPSGCSANGSITEDAGTQPQVTIEPSGSPTFCQGGSITLTANATDTDSYYWSTGETTPSITVSSTGSYSVQVFNASGCGTSDFVYVEAVQTSAQIVSGGGTICQGSSRTIETLLTGQGPWNLTWSDGFAQTVGAAGQTTLTTYREVTPATSIDYSVTTVSDASSCPATTSGSANITVSAKPTATLSGSNQMCPGGSVPLRVDLTGVAPWMLTWSDGFTQSGIAQSPVIRSVSPSSTATYAITSVRDNYCTSGTASGSATVIVAPPTATVSGDAAICPGGSATIQAALTGKGPWIVTWADGPILSYSSSTAIRMVSPSSTTTYSVMSVSDANCTGTASGSATVTVNATPSAAVSGDATICEGQSATIAVALNGTAPFSITWSDGLTQSGIPTSTATRSVSPSATTSYSIASVSDAHCAGSATGGATVTVHHAPSITTQPQSQTIRKNSTATLSVAVTSDRPVTYQWYRGTTPVGTNSPTYTTPKLSTTTTYFVRVTSACGSTNSNTATITIR